MRVVVVGAGVAGTHAAQAAASQGADVTLVEGSGRPQIPQSMLPELLDGRRNPSETKMMGEVDLRNKFGITTSFGESALGLDSVRKKLRTNRQSISYDSLVLAVGCSYAEERFKGASKEGVYALRAMEDYERLSLRLPNLSTAAILGSGVLAIQIAEILRRRNVDVKLFSPGGLLGGSLSEPISSALRSRMAEAGVRVFPHEVEAVAGDDSVEVVLSKGSVFPSEVLVVTPRSIPNTVKSDCEMGRNGGLLVDRSMHTSEKDVLAAGDCAELRMRSTSFSSHLHSVATIMGEVAGENATGSNRIAHISGVLGFSVFGTEVCTSGIMASEAASAGLSAKELTLTTPEGDNASEKDGPTCTLTFEPSAGKVLGIQIIGERAMAFADFASIVVSQSLSLKEVSFYDSPYLPGLSSDASPVSLAARAALRGLDKDA
jgi:NADPH-dependent 2,4-dienoyl-CoA reductase/sulfur reductase-like enzyme